MLVCPWAQYGGMTTLARIWPRSMNTTAEFPVVSPLSKKLAIFFPLWYPMLAVNFSKYVQFLNHPFGNTHNTIIARYMLEYRCDGKGNLNRPIIQPGPYIGLNKRYGFKCSPLPGKRLINGWDSNSASPCARLFLWRIHGYRSFLLYQR